MRSPELSMQEAAVGTFEPGDMIEYVSPQIVIVALLDDPAVLMEGKARTAVQRRAGEAFEAHGHDPLEQAETVRYRNGADVHVQGLASLGQPLAHGHEGLLALDALDGILKDDIVMIMGKKMGPVRFSPGVVGFRPEGQDVLSCK